MPEFELLSNQKQARYQLSHAATFFFASLI
jgi:hypothetical protein